MHVDELFIGINRHRHCVAYSCKRCGVVYWQDQAGAETVRMIDHAEQHEREEAGR